MLLFVIIFLIIFSGLAVWQVPKGIKPSTRRAALEYQSFSWPSHEIHYVYNSIPEANRPFQNIRYILKSLDTKYNATKVNEHFIDRYGSYDRPREVYSWNCRCYRHGGCEFKEYRDIYDALCGVRDALREQQHALEVAGVSEGLSQAKAMVESLRAERELVESVTKELIGHD